jgi:probable HAF family extracellular repeat protein
VRIVEFRRQVHVRVVQRLRAALFATAALLALAVAAAPTSALADDIQGLGLLPVAPISTATGVSADGSVVVGYSGYYGINGNTGVIEAFRWTQSSGMVGLGFLPGGGFSIANGVNGDGSVVVGQSTVVGQKTMEAFRWTQSAGMVGLGILPGGAAESYAYAVNADGSVVVGTASSGNGGEAFRWTQSTGMVSIHMQPTFLLGFSTNDVAMGVSADGSVVVGKAQNIDVRGAFRWTQSTGMVGLGFFPGGNESQANAVSADGSVVVGYSNSTSHPSGEAFRWTQSGGMVGLGFLPGGGVTESYAYAVNADGSVVVGFSSSSTGVFGEAFRWTTTTGMQSIRALLIASGVNMTGWTLATATGVSADGTVIVGSGTSPSSQNEAWLARFSSEFGNGIITPGVAAQSFAGQAAVAQTGNAVIGGSLATMSEYATQAHTTQGVRTTPYSVFAYANYDSDPSASGTFGMTVDLPDAMVAGAAVSANYTNTDMVYDGSAKMWGGSLGAFLARVPDAGLQWLLGVNGTTLSGDINRGYLNGSGQAYSQGSTTANGYGATARIGWSFNNVLRATQVTPFASYTYSTIHFNGYTETTGAFPAQFNGFDDTAQTARVGADARYTFAPGKWIWGTLASAHKINNSETENITGSLIGLFGMTAPAGPVAKDWVEATAGIRWPAWKNGALTASLTASIPANYATTYQARVGVMQMF